MFSKTTFLPICVGRIRLSVATDRFFVASDRRKIAVGQMRNKKLSYCWETVRRESMPRIAEIDVKVTT